MSAFLLPLLLSGLVPVSTALAHPGADGALWASEAALSLEPCNTELWLGRARALAADQRVDEALVAVGRAETCGVAPALARVTRGVILAEAGRGPEAMSHLDAALALDPDHAGARLVRSRLLAEAGRLREAVADAERGLAQVTQPQPDDVLRLARLYRALGDDARALSVLDRALPSPALVEEAVEIELALGRPEGALGRIDAMPATPYWLMKRAGIEAGVDR